VFEKNETFKNKDECLKRGDETNKMGFISKKAKEKRLQERRR